MAAFRAKASPKDDGTEESFDGPSDIPVDSSSSGVIVSSSPSDAREVLPSLESATLLKAARDGSYLVLASGCCKAPTREERWTDAAEATED